MLVLLACLPCQAQGLLPPQPVGFQDRIFANPTSTGSAALLATVWYPSGASTGPFAPIADPPIGGYPVVVFMHGRCSNGSTYPHLGHALASQGHVVVMESSAGCLEDLQRDDGIALFHALVQDNMDPASFLHQRINTEAMGIAGHSMGAGNVARILAANPGYKAGVAFGIWAGWNQVDWAPIYGPMVQSPIMLVHGVADTTTPIQTTLQPWWDHLVAPESVHVMHLFDASVTHFNITMPGWPVVGGALNLAVFTRSMEVTSSFFRRFLLEDPTALEYVIGNTARNASFVSLIETRVGRPQVWSDAAPATGQTHCMNVLSAQGFAGIYISPFPFLTATPIGDLLIDPLTTVPLIQGTPNGDNLLSICLPLPSDPSFVGAWFIHQGLGTTEGGALLLSNAVDFTILN